MNAIGPSACPNDLDRVEVGGVGRQLQEPGSNAAQDGGGLRAIVAGQVVEDDDVARSQGGGELGLDIEVEGVAVIGPSITQGASSRSWRNSAMKARVCQWP